VVQLIGLLTVLSLAPSIVIMTTSFVRIVVVLSLLRTALGLQQSPPNSVLISLALFLSAIVMAPTFTASYEAGVRPLLDQQIELPQAFEAAGGPVKTFMLGQVDEEDLALFIRLSKIERPATAQETPLRVVTPAFMISELKRAFEIGFLLFVPFLVIDLVVASVLMSMGHDDAAPRGRQPPLQADLLRPRRRLAPRRRLPGRKLQRGAGSGVISRKHLSERPGRSIGCCRRI
jgi:flagellar biosynthetic protein FliP